MKASEYINQLHRLMLLWGDLELIADDDLPLDVPEYNDTDGDPAFVVTT